MPANPSTKPSTPRKALKPSSAVQELLFQAVQANDPQGVDEALNQGAQANLVRKKDGESPFLLALRLGRIHAALALWDHCDWSARAGMQSLSAEIEKRGALALVVGSKRVDLLAKALASCPPEQLEWQRDGALEEACCLDWVAGVELLMPNVSPKTLALCWKRSIERRCADAAFALALGGFKPRDASLVAARLGHWRMFEALQSFESAPEAASCNQDQALGVAAAEGHEIFVRQLLARGWGDPLFENKNGATALAQAVAAGSEACVRALVGVSNPSQGRSGASALQWARRLANPLTCEGEFNPDAPDILAILNSRVQALELASCLGTGPASPKPRL
jgi:hypothetical protein